MSDEQEALLDTLRGEFATLRRREPWWRRQPSVAWRSVVLLAVGALFGATVVLGCTFAHAVAASLIVGLSAVVAEVATWLIRGRP